MKIVPVPTAAVGTGPRRIWYDEKPKAQRRMTMAYCREQGRPERDGITSAEGRPTEVKG